MTVKVAIRPATIEDVSLILSFIRELASYEKLADEVIATEAQLRSTLFGDLRVAEVVIAVVDNNPAGFALFFHNFSTFLGRPGIYLEDLYVRPDYRGQGIGRRLLAHLAALTVDRECGRLEWSVLEWNESAIRLYKSLGATPMSDWTAYRLTGDALKSLANESGS